jgi:hypothetical protein
VAHQLLKNDIENHEYWLVTKNLSQDNPLTSFAAWMEWNSSAKQTETGEVPFHYAQLSQLKNELSPEPTPPLDLSNKVKMISLSQEYETDIIKLFHATGDFHYRHRWQEGVKKVEEVNHFLPRVGMRCRCVMENGEVITYANSYFYQPDRIEFSETEEKKENLTYYTLEKTSENKTKLTLDFYIQKNIATQLIFRLMQQRKMEDSFRKSLQNLVSLLKEIRLSNGAEV